MSTSSNPPASPSGVVAFGPPFDSIDADVIFRTSDGVDFRLHKTVLSLASPLLRDMFTAPRSAPSTTLPVVDVTEHSSVLETALKFFYPGTHTAVSSPIELLDILNILVQKYDMQYILPSARAYLEKYVSDQPLAVYVVAYTYQWKELATTAAKQTLKLPLRAVSELAPAELNHLPAAAYHNLLRYHYLCASAAKFAVRNLTWVPVPVDLVWFTCTDCEAALLQFFLADKEPYEMRGWFYNYMEKISSLLMETPSLDITSHRSMQDALKEASGCEICCEKVFEQFPSWIDDALNPRILRAIENVKLTI
ncbi:BTB domain-containing protein [Favolaschia claudopus]|uniref:BTB domain-containing protein n=1 Tax=Favolaschia claudopus TaxID=2862362 RepID=A0AAW0BBW5_9AGAR